MMANNPRNGFDLGLMSGISAPIKSNDVVSRNRIGVVFVHVVKSGAGKHLKYTP